MLRAGASLRIPSSDAVFQINRGDAMSEVQRQNSAWGTGSEYSVPATTTRPSLTLVPPDEEPAVSDYSDDNSVYEPLSREQEIENLIAELEAADVPDQQSLIEIRDNNLANLRQELANIRGEVYEPPASDDPFVDGADDMAADDELADETNIEDLFPDQSELSEGDSADDAFDDEADDAADDAAADAPGDTPTVVTTPREAEKGIVDQIIEFVSGTVGMIIIGAVALVLALLFWFARRGGGDDEDIDRPWERLDDDEMADAGTLSSTESMQAPTPEEAFVVVEQDSGVHPVIEDETIETPAAAPAAEETGSQFGSLEDTFSSETAVNLDQTDPIAEADFHMAYGLYDQAADLINGALETDPSDKGLVSKLCEIYFVWGNRDSFVDAATRLKSIVGDGGSADWDKIVIMGQQIAADHQMFAGAEVAGATKAVDLSFEDDGAQASALDMDFGADDGSSSDIVDLGGGDETQEDVDFMFGETAAGDDELDMALEPTAESPTIGVAETEKTAEMPSPTVETPTIEEQFEGFGEGTSELPSLDESLGQAISDSGQDAEATAEINLDELDLDVDGLAETELASLDDLDATGQNEMLSDTGINEAFEDAIEATGKNPEIDPNSTGIREGLDVSDFEDLDATGEMRLATDETGRSPMFDAEQAVSDIGIDDTLLDATGHTQILSDDMAVETAADLEDALGDADATMLASVGGDDETIETLAADAETLLAPLDGDDDDFDFAKTEALPVEAFSGDDDETAGTVALAGTDVDLDLDDLTAALQVSEIGDTVQQPRDDATVEQPRPSMSDETASVPTMNLSPDDMSDDLQEARTMTEVGTKLDLARAYVDMGDPAGARSILEEVLDEGDDSQKQQAQQLLDTLPS
ncbi:MAG: hypothetical protein K0U72_01190 [Gammaproteobacteria bacterium]|nr:hypothetical protein [Gammaproteobacteria bacterium]